MRNNKYDRYAGGPGRFTAHGFIPMRPLKVAPKADVLEWLFSGTLLVLVVVAIRLFGI